jgi:hypothetical protein
VDGERFREGSPGLYDDRSRVKAGLWNRIALPLIEQAEAGSLPAAIKLMCLDCSGWERNDVRDCVIDWCPLYPHRPYQEVKGGA